MTDLAPIFNEELEKRQAPCLHPYRISEHNDEFMKEAYAIISHITKLTNFLLSIRQAYLSTARSPRHIQHSSSSSSSSMEKKKYFTDRERDDIDFEAKSMIRQYMRVISNLEAAEKVRVQTEETARKRDISFGRLMRDIRRGVDGLPSEEEEKSRWLSLHREGVLWLLKNRLERLSEVQREQQETRVMRAIEKNKSILQKSAVGASGSSSSSSSAAMASAAAIRQAKAADKGVKATAGYDFYGEGEDVEKVLSPDQLQLFAQENHDMLKQYEDTLDMVKTAEKSLIEISGLQTQLATNLAVQSAHIDQLFADSVSTSENMEAANKQLKDAKRRGSSARWVFRFSLGFCAFLIFMDLIM